MHNANRHICPTKQRVAQKIDVIIPAAGEYYKSNSFGAKSLQEICGESIIDRQIRLINSVFSNCNIILTLGFEANKVMAKTPNNILKLENTDYKMSNTAKSIGIALRASLSPYVLLIHGDLMFNEQALSFPMKRESFLIIDNSMMPIKGEEEVGCIVNEKHVESLTYIAKDKWAQIAYFTGRELQLLKQLCWIHRNRKMFTWEIINKIIDMGGKFSIIKPNGIKTYDIDGPEDLLNAERLFTC